MKITQQHGKHELVYDVEVNKGKTDLKKDMQRTDLLKYYLYCHISGRYQLLVSHSCHQLLTAT